MRTESHSAANRGFTVLELLVVLAIIVILATLTLPALKGIGEGNLMTSASRQVVDAVALARQRAIGERTTVFLLFAGPVSGPPVSAPLQPGLLTRQYKSYAMFAERTAGDQPGQHHSRYLADWEDLPDGILFATWKFGDPTMPPAPTAEDAEVWTFDYRVFPYPEADSTELVWFPYIAFGPDGGVTSTVPSSGEVRIPLAKGNYFLGKGVGPGAALAWVPAVPREQPPGNSVDIKNHVLIDALTGRGRVDRLEIQ